MNEYQILELVIAYWPLIRLEVGRLLPIPSLLFHFAYQGQDDDVDTIAKLLERKLSDGSSLLDYIVMGLVNKRENLSQLKIVDFRGCSSSSFSVVFLLRQRKFSCLIFKGIQMTKELYRLPLLWISPERRCLLQKRMCKSKDALR